MNFIYHEKLLFLFNNAAPSICILTVGFVFRLIRAMEKRANHTYQSVNIAINLQILLL